MQQTEAGRRATTFSSLWEWHPSSCLSERGQRARTVEDPAKKTETGNNVNLLATSGFPDTWHLGTDPDPRIRTRIRQWLSRCQKIEIKGFLYYRILLVDGRIRIRIQINYGSVCGYKKPKNIRIRIRIGNTSGSSTNEIEKMNTITLVLIPIFSDMFLYQPVRKYILDKMTLG